MLPRPPTSTLFPYTTLFRSLLVATQLTIFSVTLYLHRSQAHRGVDFHPVLAHFFRLWTWLTTSMITREWAAIRSEEHTSELQSLAYLVCRLLLEKKKQYLNPPTLTCSFPHATAPTDIYPLSLHDALPISARRHAADHLLGHPVPAPQPGPSRRGFPPRARALLPFLDVAHHVDDHARMGGDQIGRAHV